MLRMTIITGIVKKTWEQEMKMVGYIIVEDGKHSTKYEINHENIEKVKLIINEAKNNGQKIEQRKLWLNENLNPLQSA